MDAPVAPTCPLPLTFAEGRDLRQRLEDALATAQDAFLKANIKTEPDGTPIGGPDPRSVNVETLFVLARYLARAGLDVVDATAFEAKLAALEGELTALQSRKPRRPPPLDTVPSGFARCGKCGDVFDNDDDCPTCYPRHAVGQR